MGEGFVNDLMVATVSVDTSLAETILSTSPDLLSKRIRGTVNVSEAGNSVARDFNTMLKDLRGQSEYIALVHDDVWLPEGWADEVLEQIAVVESRDCEWGVLGVAGARWEPLLGQDGQKVYEGNLKDRTYPYTGESALPCRVDTLDEVCLIVRNDGETRLNDQYTSHHLYGAELCLRLGRAGAWSWAIDASLEHRGTNSRDDVKDREFYFNAGQLWREYGDQWGPIATNCTTIRLIDGVVRMKK